MKLSKYEKDDNFYFEKLLIVIIWWAVSQDKIGGFHNGSFDVPILYVPKINWGYFWDV